MLTDARDFDVTLVTDNSNQRVLFGFGNNAAGRVIMSDSNVVVRTDLGVSGSLSASNLFVGGSNSLNLFAPSNHIHDLAGGNIAGVLPANKGGTGVNNLTANKLSLGNGANAISAVDALHWNGTNLGVGTGTPSTLLHVNGEATVNSNLNVSGKVGIQTTTPVHALDVNGTISASGLVTGQIQAKPDSASVPSYSWSNDSNTGFYSVSTHHIGVASAGSLICTLTSGRQIFENNRVLSWKRSDGTTTDILYVDTINRVRLFSPNGDIFINENANNTCHINHNNLGKVMIYNGTTAIMASSGNNIGIGTTTPSSALHVIGVINASSKLQQGGTDISTLFAPSNHTHSADAISSGTLSRDRLPSATTSLAGTVVLSDSTSDSSTSKAATANAVRSAYNHADAALPKSGGTITGVLELWRDVTCSQSINIFSTGAQQFQFASFGCTVYKQLWLSTYPNGTLFVSGGQVGSSSDKRCKQNISYLDEPFLDKVLSLKPALFEYINDPGNKRCGFIAQDVEEVIPVAVDAKKYEYQFQRDSDGKIKLDENNQPLLDYNQPRYRGFDNIAITAYTVGAIQELAKKCLLSHDELRTQLQNMQADIADLRTALDTLTKNMLT
jgi:hypothetical protein